MRFPLRFPAQFARVVLLVALLGLWEEAVSAHDLTLVDCLRIAIDHNSRLRAVSEQILDAQGRALRLHAILYPSVNAVGLTAPATLYVQVNEVLYSRATFPQLRISRLAWEQAAINYRQTLDDVIFQIRQAFAQALAARKSDELLRAYVSRQAGTLSSAQNLFQAGKIRRSELLGVEVAQNHLAQQQVDSQLGITQSELALANLLGQKLPPDSHPAGNLEAAIPKELEQAKLIDHALQNRADLKLLESVRLTEQQQILVDRRNALPVVGFSSNSAFSPPTVGPISNFDLQRNYNEPQIQRQEGNSQLPLSLYVNWTIFDGGTTAGLGISDRAQIETQAVAIEELKRSIPDEVINAVAAVKAERETLRQLDALTPTGDVRHSGELDYQAGRIRQLDLANLENEILAREQTRLGAQVRLSLALAALDHALGRDLLAGPPPPPISHP